MAEAMGTITTCSAGISRNEPKPAMTLPELVVKDALSARDPVIGRASRASGLPRLTQWVVESGSRRAGQGSPPDSKNVIGARPNRGLCALPPRHQAVVETPPLKLWRLPTPSLIWADQGGFMNSPQRGVHERTPRVFAKPRRGHPRRGFSRRAPVWSASMHFMGRSLPLSSGSRPVLERAEAGSAPGALSASAAGLQSGGRAVPSGRSGGSTISPQVPLRRLWRGLGCAACSARFLARKLRMRSRL